MKREHDICSKCAEGCIIGKRVYCGINRCFYSLGDNIGCEMFNPKNQADALWSNITKAKKTQVK